MRRVAVTGAASFIGQHLVRHLYTHGDAEVRILIHENKPKHVMDIKGIVPVEGDLLKRDTLTRLLEPDCTVINLAYLSRPPLRENLSTIENLTEKCSEMPIKRLIHCSTAVVVGGVRNDVVTEETPCDPQNEYETTKLQIEELLKSKAQGRFELAILRPTAVFGPGGRNLIKLADDLTHGNRILNYIKSCLFNHRRMNLVYVDTVVSALLFLAFTAQKMNGDTFIISDDEYPMNNYRDIETYLIKEFGCRDYPLPRIPLRPFLLSCMLRLAGRSNSNPHRIYRSEKIQSLGYQKETSFETGLASFSEWYKEAYLTPQRTE